MNNSVSMLNMLDKDISLRVVALLLDLVEHTQKGCEDSDSNIRDLTRSLLVSMLIEQVEREE
jgi:hypothetical protein